MEFFFAKPVVVIIIESKYRLIVYCVHDGLYLLYAVAMPFVVLYLPPGVCGTIPSTKQCILYC